MTYLNGNGKAHSNGQTRGQDVPSAWMRFLFRIAGLERGRIYTLTLIVPDKADSEPLWTIHDGGRLENGHRV